MGRKLLSILVTAFLAAMSHPASAQTSEQLIAGAKKEGRLILYASATAPQLQSILRRSIKSIRLSRRNSFAPANKRY